MVWFLYYHESNKSHTEVRYHKLSVFWLWTCWEMLYKIFTIPLVDFDWKIQSSVLDILSLCTLFVNKKRSSYRRCSVKNGVLKNYASFTAKHLCWSLFLIKFQASDLVFSYTFYDIFKNTCVFIVEGVGKKELNVIWRQIIFS